MEDCDPLRLAAIVLAAGSSRRMGDKNKLLEKVQSQSMIRAAVSTLCQSGIEKVVVITGFQSDQLKAELAGLKIDIIHNDLFEHGLSASLKIGLSSLPSNIDVAVIALADMPFLKILELHNLISACRAGDERTIVVPVAKGRRGNPVLWPRHYWPEIAALEGDQGAKSLIAKYTAHVVEVEVDNDGCFIDIDTPQALAQYRNGLGDFVNDC
jgi:molybdenum cofactor cytidylyltransferase